MVNMHFDPNRFANDIQTLATFNRKMDSHRIGIVTDSSGNQVIAVVHKIKILFDNIFGALFGYFGYTRKYADFSGDGKNAKKNVLHSVIERFESTVEFSIRKEKQLSSQEKRDLISAIGSMTGPETLTSLKEVKKVFESLRRWNANHYPQPSFSSVSEVESLFDNLIAMRNNPKHLDWRRLEEALPPPPVSSPPSNLDISALRGLIKSLEQDLLTQRQNNQVARLTLPANTPASPLLTKINQLQQERVTLEKSYTQQLKVLDQYEKNLTETLKIRKEYLENALQQEKDKHVQLDAFVKTPSLLSDESSLQNLRQQINILEIGINSLKSVVTTNNEQISKLPKKMSYLDQRNLTSQLQKAYINALENELENKRQVLAGHTLKQDLSQFATFSEQSKLALERQYANLQTMLTPKEALSIQNDIITQLNERKINSLEKELSELQNKQATRSPSPPSETAPVNPPPQKQEKPVSTEPPKIALPSPSAPNTSSAQPIITQKEEKKSPVEEIKAPSKPIKVTTKKATPKKDEPSSPKAEVEANKVEVEEKKGNSVADLFAILRKAKRHPDGSNIVTTSYRNESQTAPTPTSPSTPAAEETSEKPSLVKSMLKKFGG